MVVKKKEKKDEEIRVVLRVGYNLQQMVVTGEILANISWKIRIYIVYDLKESPGRDANWLVLSYPIECCKWVSSPSTQVAQTPFPLAFLSFPFLSLLLLRF